MTMYDVVVIGLGGVGSFALRSLAKELRGQGKKILGIERFERGHAKGSSHGESRLFRKAYFEDERYIPWLEYSIQEFEKLEKENNVSLLNKCGNLILQDKPTKDTPIKKNYLQLAMDTAKRHDIEVEFMEQDALKRRFPQFRCHEGTELVGLLEPGAGFVRPERAMNAAIQQAEECQEVSIWENAVVKSLRELPSKTLSSDAGRPEVEVVVERGKDQVKVKTQTVLISAGAWASQLIPSWSKHLTVTRQVQGWVDITQSESLDLYKPEKMPTFIMATRNWHLPFFGAPVTTEENGPPGRGVKVGTHNDVDKIEDPTNNPAKISKKEIAEYQRAVEVAIDGRAWSKATSKNSTNLLQTIPCMYTMTPDEDFLIGVPEEFQSVYAIADLSGHGFKMAPALGQMLSDFHLIGEEKLNAKWNPHVFCSPSRFDRGINK